MSFEFVTKLPTPEEIRLQYPITEKIARVKAQRDQEIKDIFTGKSDRFLVIIGPCSADREDAVLEYAARLRWTAGPLLSALSAERLNSTDRKPLLFAHFPSGARPQRRV